MTINDLQKQTNVNIQEKANLIWESATHLVGLFKPHEYGKVILPLTLLKHFVGTFTNGDRVIVDGIFQMFMKDADMKKFKQYAKDNSSEMFVESLFPDKFKSILTQCFLDNNAAFQKLFNDPEFYQKVQEAMAKEIYKSLKRN